MDKLELDHADIVVTHQCNFGCKFCIDKYRNMTSEEVSIHRIETFLETLKKYTEKELEVLLLGGEPTMLSTDKLICIANTIRKWGFSPIMSTNGVDKNIILQILPHFDWIQVTVHSDKDIDFWREYKDKINIKLSGDGKLTLEKLQHYIEYTKDYVRRSISMYFTPDWVELCTDTKIWDILNQLKWERNGSYLYTFYEGIRIKKCIPNETNLIDEPTVPKLYPNGNYNKTWCNEDNDPYLENEL